VSRPIGVLVAAGLAAAALGVILDMVWPYTMLILRVQTGPGPVLAAVGAVVSVVVAGLWLVSHLLGKSRLTAASARSQAISWEQRARSQEAAHRRFMRDLDHELKNPLQAIKTAFAAFDARDGTAASLQTAERQVERLRHLASRLRQLATVESATLVRENVDLEELVEESIELARAAVDGAASRITLSSQRVPWRPEQVLADRELLSHAIYNLLDNALKYSPPEAPVEVRLREDGSSATIEVADTGRGIHADDLPHVFDELYRGQHARNVDGSGLGLSLARRVAEAHGGALELRSRAGQGTIAALRLPVERAS
jgi:two-component system, OmpR family, sensor kinase